MSAFDYFIQMSLAAHENQKHYSDLGRETSTVWNFCARLRGNHWWRREISAVFSGYAGYEKRNYFFDRIRSTLSCMVVSSLFILKLLSSVEIKETAGR